MFHFLQPDEILGIENPSLWLFYVIFSEKSGLVPMPFQLVSSWQSFSRLLNPDWSIQFSACQPYAGMNGLI